MMSGVGGASAGEAESDGASSMHPPAPRGGTAIDMTISSEDASSKTPMRRASTRVKARTPTPTAAVTPSSSAVVDKGQLYKTIDHILRDSIAKLHKSEDFQTTLGSAFASKAVGHVVKGLVQKVNVEPSKSAQDRHRKVLAYEAGRVFDGVLKPHVKAATEVRIVSRG